MEPDLQSPASRPSNWALFAGFFSISAMGFGGVIPWARWLIVERKGWLSPHDFNEVMTLAQMLPGGNIINMAVILGHRYHGVSGALAGVAGLIAAPFGLVIGLALIYDRLRDFPGVDGTLEAVSAAAVGLVVAMAAKILVTLKDDWAALGIAVISFLGVGLLRLPLLPTLAVIGPLSIAYSWYRIRKALP